MMIDPFVVEYKKFLLLGHPSPLLFKAIECGIYI